MSYYYKKPDGGVIESITKLPMLQEISYELYCAERAMTVVQAELKEVLEDPRMDDGYQDGYQGGED